MKVIFLSRHLPVDGNSSASRSLDSPQEPAVEPPEPPEPLEIPETPGKKAIKIAKER